MLSGTLFMWLLLVPGAGPSDVYVMSTRDIAIPITIDPTRRSEIEHMILWVSPDRGQTWREGGVAKPDTPAFTYKAHDDGHYWFIVQIVDKQNRKEPENPAAADVGKKVIIDTVRPDIRLTAERSGDQVVATWDIHEENPDMTSLRMDYRTSEMPAGTFGAVDDHAGIARSDFVSRE